MSGRLLFEAGSVATFDLKAKYSELDSGAINFNALDRACRRGAASSASGTSTRTRTSTTSATSTTSTRSNEQENINLSLIKGDWDVGIGTLTSYLAYNDQTNYFLTDGTSDAFLLYAFNNPANNSEAAATCQADERRRTSPMPGYEAAVLRHSVEHLVHACEGGGAAGFLPPYGPSTCGGYQYQQRDQEDLSLEVAPHLDRATSRCAGWWARISPTSIADVVVVAGFGPRNRQLLGAPVRAGRRPQPDRPAVRRHYKTARSTPSSARSPTT